MSGESRSLQAAGLSSNLDELLQALDLVGRAVVKAGWAAGLRDFWLDLDDGRRVLFGECLQASLHRPIALPEPPRIEGWWIDEPSPVLQSLAPEVRFLYHHLVFDLGESLLRIACRGVSLVSEQDEQG